MQGMVLGVRYYESDALHPDRFLFKFEELSLRYRFEFFRRHLSDDPSSDPAFFSGDPKKTFQPVFKRVLPGDQVFAVFPRTIGKIFRFFIPVSKKQSMTVVIGSRRSFVKDPKLPLTINNRTFSRAFVSSDRKKKKRRVLCSEIRNGNQRIIYIPPENLKIKNFRSELDKIIGKHAVDLILIDDVHFISEWAPGFFPSNRRISTFISDMKIRNPDMIVLGVMPSEGNIIKRDVVRYLGLREGNLEREWSPYRENLSFQILLVDDFGEKAVLHEKVMVEDIPKALSCANLKKVFQLGAGFLSIYPDQEGDLGMEETKSILSEQDFRFNYYSPGESGMEPSDPEAGEDPNDFPDPSIIGDLNVVAADRFVIHLRMAEGIENWVQGTGRAGSDGLRAHCVQIVNMPDPRCEVDMRNRFSLEPLCDKEGCPFGRKPLCDYGKQHVFIRETERDADSEVMDVLYVLDKLMDAVHKGGQDPLRIPFSQNEEKLVEMALFRLSTLEFIHTYWLDYQERSGIFEITGFRPDMDENQVLGGLLRFFKRNDISSTGIFSETRVYHLFGGKGLLAEISGKYDENIRGLIERGIGEKKLMRYSENRKLYERTALFVFAMIDYILENSRAMRYGALWNLKEYLRGESCCTADFLKRYHPVPETWKCGVCDRCHSDLRFQIRPLPGPDPTLIELEQNIREWLENPDVPFDFNTAEAQRDRCGVFASNIFMRSSAILEKDPRNLKALYLCRECSPENAKKKTTLDLIRVAVRETDRETVIAFYETSRENIEIRKAELEIIDNEYGVFHSEKGEAWIRDEAIKLSFPPKTIEMMDSRLFINEFDKHDFSEERDRLNNLLKEI